MSKIDKAGISIRSMTLIIALGIAANMWRTPDGWKHYAEMLTICFCVVLRERLPYWSSGTPQKERN